MYEWHENVKVEVRDRDGVLLDSTQNHNLITDGALNWLMDALRSTQNSKIYYLGWGASSGATSTAQTALSTESGRKLVTTQSSGTVGVCQTITYIAPTEGNGNIQELAWFAGSSASATAGSGRMISRYLYSRTKTSLENLTITRTDTLVRTTS